MREFVPSSTRLENRRAPTTRHRRFCVIAQLSLYTSRRAADTNMHSVRMGEKKKNTTRDRIP